MKNEMDTVIKIDGDFVGWDSADQSLLGLASNKWAGMGFPTPEQAAKFLDTLSNNATSLSWDALEDEYTAELIEALKDIEHKEVEFEKR